MTIASTWTRIDSTDTYSTSSIASSSMFDSTISMLNMATSDLINTLMCSSCYMISNDRLCRTTNMRLIESMAGDTENVMTHHSSINNISRQFCSVHSKIGRQCCFKKLSKSPRCTQRFVFFGHLTPCWWWGCSTHTRGPRTCRRTWPTCRHWCLQQPTWRQCRSNATDTKCAARCSQCTQQWGWQDLQGVQSSFSRHPKTCRSA